MNYQQKAKKYKIKYLKLKKELEQKYGKSIDELQKIYGGDIARLRQIQQLSLDQYKLAYDEIKEQEQDNKNEESDNEESDNDEKVNDMITKLSPYKTTKNYTGNDKMDSFSTFDNQSPQTPTKKNTNYRNNITGGLNENIYEYIKIPKCSTIDKLKEMLIKKLKKNKCNVLDDTDNIISFNYNNEFNFTITIEELDERFRITYDSSNKEHLYNTLITTIIRRICFNPKNNGEKLKQLQNVKESFNNLQTFINRKNEHKEIDFPVNLNIDSNNIRKITFYQNKDSEYLKQNIIQVITFIQDIFDMLPNKMNGGGNIEKYNLTKLLDKLLSLDINDETKKIITFYRDFFVKNKQEININVIQNFGEHFDDINKRLSEHIQIIILENTDLSIDNIVSDINVLQNFILLIQNMYNIIDNVDSEIYSELTKLLRIINAVRYEIRQDKFNLNILTFYYNALLNKILEYNNNNNIENKDIENDFVEPNDIYNPENEDTNEIKLNFNPMNRTERNLGNSNTENKLNKTTKNW